jgi:outer membrane protein OmpA-like peptidoglycan-associated protein
MATVLPHPCHRNVGAVVLDPNPTSLSQRHDGKDNMSRATHIFLAGTMLSAVVPPAAITIARAEPMLIAQQQQELTPEQRRQQQLQQQKRPGAPAQVPPGGHPPAAQGQHPPGAPAQAQPAPAQQPHPAQTQPGRQPPQPAQTQPAPGQPHPPQPAQTQPVPGQPRPAQTLPAPGQPRPAQPAQTQPAPGQPAQPVQTQPTPGQARPAQTQPAPGQPSHPGQPAQTLPAPGQPRPAQPAQTQPTPGQPPHGQQPAQTQPAPGQPPRPAQPAQTLPGQPVRPQQPAQTQPAPTQGPNQVPVQPQRPAQNAPVQPGQPQAQPQRPAQAAPVAPLPTPTGPAQAQPLRPTGAAPAIEPRSAQGQPLRRIDDLRAERRESVEGNRTVIREPDRVIVRENDGRFFIRHSEVDRFRYNARDVRIEREGNDNVTIIDRPDGSRVVTVVDGNGTLLRRVRRLPDGREIVIIDNSFRGPMVAANYNYYVDLPPPVVRIPRERYIVETERASPEMIYDALVAPPIDRLERRYTLDEIRFSPMLRDRMPRVDIDTVTFDSGSWELSPDQIDRLSVIGAALNRAISRNPREVFLIEGYTDAVGSDVDNLSLSDRRAESVALVLSERFQVPPENLSTQGYGKQYLKVPTDGPERENRRVTVRRITPLLAGQAE